MPWKPIDRRTVLKGFLRGGLISIGLPPLEAFMNASGTAYACGTGFPKRFGVYTWGNGNLPNYWTPTGEGSEWELSEQLAPLANVKDRISIVSGMSVKVENLYPHWSGAGGILSGAPLTADGEDYTFSLPTIDQVIAAEIGGSTLYRSLITAAYDSGTALSYNGPHSPNYPEADPWAFFDRIFGEAFRGPGDDGAIDPTLALRQSVLDSVMEDMDKLMGRVGYNDKLRLEEHFEGIRELEQRLAMLQEDPPDLEACASPAEPDAAYDDIEGRPQLDARNQVFCDILAMALACDQTRVFNHAISSPVNNMLFTDASGGHHDLTHDEADPQPEVNQITIQCVENLAYLIEALDAIPEGDGTLLDNCAVLGTSDVSEGRTHSIDEMPIVIAGGACGSLLQGVHYRSYTQENASKVLFSLIKAMDVSISEFGMDEAYVTEGLSAIEA